MKKYSRLSFLLLVTAFLCFFVLPAVAADRIVDNSGDLNPGSIVEPVYPTIQMAVDAALSGDTITVKTGTYREHVQISGKSLNFEVDGDVNLTVPEPEVFSASDWAVWSEDLPEMTSPVISIDQGAAQSVEVSFEGFNFVAPQPFTCDPCYAVSAALFAGNGTSLSVTDCEFSGAFMVPVMVTTYEEVFNDMVFDEFDFYIQGTMPTANLEMSGCSFQNYLLAGTSLVGPEVSGTITNNSFSGMTMESPDSSELDPAMVVDGFRSSVLSGTLFSQGIDRNYVRYIPMGAAGVLLLNSGQNEEVVLSGNTITGNLLGIGVLKDFRVEPGGFESSFIEEGTDTTISGNESISGNLVGVAVIGGFAEQLVWSPDYGIYLDEYVESWDLYESYTTTLELSGEEHIEGNIIGTLLVGGVSADVNSCYFKDNLLAGMVALGDLEGSVISNNEFSGTVGVNLLYGLGSSFWNMLDPVAPLSDTEPTVAVEITGNTFAGNGLVEGAHEFISYLLGGEEGDVLSLTSSMATRMGSFGPMAILPSGFSPSQSMEGTPTLAGVILLDGVSLVNFHNNEVTGSILGITAMDVGFSNIINDMEEESVISIPGLYRVMIQNNDITGNLSGVNLLGTRELVSAALYDAPEKSLDPSFEYLPYGLDEFVVRGNNISENHFGVVNALDVQDLSFTGNRVNNNYVMGMINAGMGAWAFREFFSDDIYDYPEVIPSARIFGNSFNYNGIVDSELDDLPIGTETLGAYIKGGILVFDVPTYDLYDNVQPESYPSPSFFEFSINRNAIKGNGNYGLAVVGRVDELHYTSVEPISTDLCFDASENFWGDPSGPSSYFGEASEVVFFDPLTSESADNAGDAITGIVFEEDGQYYPYDFRAEALYVHPLNCIRFDPWLGENGEDVTGVTGGEVVNGEEGSVEQDMGDGNTVTATFNGEGDWTLVRYGQNPGKTPDLQVNAGGYYSLDVEGYVSEITLRFNVSSSSAPDIYWYNSESGEWVKLTPSASGSGFVEFTFNSESDPTIEELLGSYASGSLVPGDSTLDTVYFAQSGTTSGGGSSGGGGCNIAWAGIPSIALLLPLITLFLKK